MLSARDCGDNLVIAPSFMLNNHNHAGHNSSNNTSNVGHGVLNTLLSHLI